MVDLIPILTDGLTDEEIIDKCYVIFKQSILNKDRPDLFGKKIYIPIEWLNYKAEMFWHVSSLSSIEDFKILPCNNDVSSVNCRKNCIENTGGITLSNGETRTLCHYRMTRVNWIREIIDLANIHNDRVKVWKKVQKDNKENLYLRYVYREIDYILVFEEKVNRYILKSAYPLFFIESKRNHDKDYNKYRK